MNKISACIFDLDGVIVDTAKYHFLSWQRLAKDFGYQFKVQDNEQLKGASRQHSLDMILELAGVKKTVLEKEALCEIKNTWYLQYIDTLAEDEVLSGVVLFLKELQSLSIKIALGSASKNARHIIDKLNIGNYFDVIIDGTDTTVGKPDPEVFLLGASRLQVAPEACIVFEDAAKGIEAAGRANMLSVGIGSPESLSKANLVLPSFENLTWSQLLLDINKNTPLQ